MTLFAANTLLAACDPSSSFFGFMGVTSAIVFANLGAAYGTAKSGVGISSMGVMRPDLVMRSIIPVVMAGVLGIYGLITAVIINGKLDQPDTYSAYSGYAHLGAGLTVGMSSLAAGLAIGIVGDASGCYAYKSEILGILQAFGHRRCLVATPGQLLVGLSGRLT